MNRNRSERGGASIKLLFVLMALYAIANAGLNYIPVAYSAENFKSELYSAVVQGTVMPDRGGNLLDTVRQKVKRAAEANNLPDDAVLEVKQVNKVVQARVSYDVPVQVLPFGLYTHQYHFDHTVTPNGYLIKE